MVYAFLPGAPGAPEAAIHSGQGLYFQGDMFYYMAHPGAIFYPLKKSSRVAFRAEMMV
jgi:hypothetical protein